MATKRTKLELTWIGKESRPRLEPRVLVEDQVQSYQASHRLSENDIFENSLIFGDNLLALKALEYKYRGKIKCIYIDPPYNTGQAFEHYDDGVEASIWLSLMKERLELLKQLLSKDGTIFVQIDDNYMAHLKLLMDEVFGPDAYINTITVKTKTSSGASGGGEDKRLKKNIEFILCYCRNEFNKFNDIYEEIELSQYLEEMAISGKSFKYTTVITDFGNKTYFKTIKDGGGNDIKVFKHQGTVTKSVSRLAREENVSEMDIFKKYYDKIMTTENAQTSIRTRVQEATDEEDNFYSIEYIPVSGRNKGKVTDVYFVGPQKRLVGWFKNVSTKKRGHIFKKEKIGTFWEGFNWNNVTREGGVRFPNGQKPEQLISQIIEMATNPGDLVLDSFAGSGTTGAVAHKMGRRWIMVELGEHCHTHIIPRMKKVIDGTDPGGVTEATGWKGGGGFRYYRLAPSLLEKDPWGNWVINKTYNPALLTEALCKLHGFAYEPSRDTYWMQGRSSETDFIYVTTQTLTQAQLRALSEEVGDYRSLLVCCAAFKGDSDTYPNLTLKKIPHSVLAKCEWGKDDYSLNIKNLPSAPALDPEPDPPAAAVAPKRRGRPSKAASPSAGTPPLGLDETGTEVEA